MMDVAQQLAAIRGAKQAIKTATTVDEIKAPLLTIVEFLERDAENEVIDADLIVGRRKPSDTHSV